MPTSPVESRTLVIDPKTNSFTNRRASAPASYSLETVNFNAASAGYFQARRQRLRPIPPRHAIHRPLCKFDPELYKQQLKQKIMESLFRDQRDQQVSINRDLEVMITDEPLEWRTVNANEIPRSTPSLDDIDALLILRRARSHIEVPVHIDEPQCDQSKANLWQSWRDSRSNATASLM